MPRGAATSKRQPGAANQRDTRHENGLVGPGRKVQRQKSNGQLNGHAKSTESNASTTRLPGPPPSNGHARHSLSCGNMAENKMGAEISRKASVDGSSDSASDVFQHASRTPASLEHRQINVNAAKNPAVHHDALSFALTVLRSCPLWDTLAILIVLLQIPPTFLSIIHLLFATLTFVPPSTTATSGLSFTDILHGTLGTPSVGTIFLIDVIVLMVWLFLWSPLQDIALDLAQTVIALTLGGGTSGKGAGMKNVLWCFSVVGVSHYFRGNPIQHSGLRAIVASSNGFLGSPDPDDPLEPRSGNSAQRHGLIRSILAIHILTQGVVRYIRDWYVRREKRDNSASIGDAEAGKALDGGSDTTLNTHTQENESSSSLAGGISAATFKKKKKQSAQVRIQQPLWAALASTKIVMVKEYETSHTASESAGANATGTNDLGNAPFNFEADRIWITSIGADEIAFSTSFFPIHKTTHACQESKGLNYSGIDKSKPFYVKVNNTTWQPTRINSTADSEQTTGEHVRWSGVVVGLAPTSIYLCDFHSTLDDSLIFSARVRTLQSSSADLSIGLSPGPHGTGRPGSPTSTLRTSIGTQELKLQDERRTLKANRKDHRSKLGTIRKEIERLTFTLQSLGPNDDKLAQKAYQNHLNKTQAEERIQELQSEIEGFQKAPTDDTARYSSAKAEIQSERDMHKLARSDFNAAKQAAERQIEERKNELAGLRHKSETKLARISFLNARHENLTDANAKGLDEAQRKGNDREAKKRNREKIHEFYTGRVHDLNLQIQDGTAALHALGSAIETLQQLHQQQNMYQSNQSPDASTRNLNNGFPPDAIPENGGINASSYPWNPSTSSSLYSSGGHSGMTVTAGPSYSPHGNRSRGRSSSMLSNVSGFTQSSSEGPGASSAFYPGAGAPKMWSDAREERKASSASASGSGSISGSGSLSDPKSPTVSNLRASNR